MLGMAQTLAYPRQSPRLSRTRVGAHTIAAFESAMTRIFRHKTDEGCVSDVEV